jgi:hypothetical protein
VIERLTEALHYGFGEATWKVWLSMSSRLPAGVSNASLVERTQ